MRQRRFGTLFLVLAVLLSTLPIAVTARAESEYATGLLWRIEAANGARSHIFGTIHLTEPRVVKLPQPVLAAFQNSRSLTLEVIRTPEVQRAAASMMILSDGRTLDQVIGGELFAKLANRAKAIGIPEHALRRFKPWASAIMLSLPRKELARRATGAQQLDFALLESARLRGLPQFGLETVQEQIGIFDGLAEVDQITVLRLAIEDHPRLDTVVGQMVDLYLARDLAGLAEGWTKEKLRLGRRLANLIERRILIDRNVTMVERMQPRLGDGGAFVAVGAMHLPGRKGVLALLARRGFRVTRVY